MKISAIIFLFILTFAAQAEVRKIAIITSEFDSNVGEFFLETNDQNQVHSIRYVTILPNGGIFEDVSASAETIIDQGVVLVVRDGHQAVKLEVENFSVTEGGIVKLNYLYSGVTGARQNKRLTLKLHEKKFTLHDGEGAKANRMFLVANRSRIFGIIGVREVRTSYVEDPTL